MTNSVAMSTASNQNGNKNVISITRIQSFLEKWAIPDWGQVIEKSSLKHPATSDRVGCDYIGAGMDF